MEWVLNIIAVLIMIVGVAGAILPVIPGPPLCFLALLLLKFSSDAQFSVSFMVIMLILTIVVTALDMIVPAWGTKRFGGTKAGVRGSIVGLITGIFFFPPFGIILGPAIGAIAGELMVQHNRPGLALKSGFGSLIGFLTGTGLKLMACLVMATYFFIALANIYWK